MKRLALTLILAALAAVGIVACSGGTTSTSNITSTSATLNGHGKCDGGTPNPCEYQWRWRPVGTSTWTFSPESGKIVATTNDVPLHQNISGLTPNTSYEWQLGGKGDQVANYAWTNSLTFKTLTGTSGSVVVGAVGDICNESGCAEGKRTAATIASFGPSVVAGLGDYQYQNAGSGGSTFKANFQVAWTGLVTITDPVFGATHDTDDGSGSWEGYPVSYFNGSGGPGARGKLSEHQWGYSFDIGKWHVVALNYKSGDTASLQADLNAHPSQCLLATDHAPIYGSPTSTHPTNEGAFYKQTLLNAGVDLILSGHQHMYERVVADGLTSITDGMGGEGHYSRTGTASGSVAYNSSAWGPLKVVLSDTGWTSQFVQNAGSSNFTDTASGTC